MKLGLVSAPTAYLLVSLALLLRQPGDMSGPPDLHVLQQPAASEDARRAPRGFTASFPGRLAGRQGSRLHCLSQALGNRQPGKIPRSR